MPDGNHDVKGKGKERTDFQVVRSGTSQPQRWAFEGFTVSCTPFIGSIPLSPGDALHCQVSFDKPENAARFEVRLIGRCVVNKDQICIFLSTGPAPFIPALCNPSLHRWTIAVPFWSSCSCEPNPFPLPSTSSGVAGAQQRGGGKTWEIEYMLECRLSEYGQRSWGLGKREVKEGQPQHLPIRISHVITPPVARRTPLLELVAPRLSSLSLERNIKPADKVDCQFYGDVVSLKRTIEWYLESADVEDFRTKQVELRFQITTPDPPSATSNASPQQAPTFKYRFTTSFGTRRYPSVQPFVQRLSSLRSCATIKIDKVATLRWNDGMGGGGKEQVREGMLVRPFVKGEKGMGEEAKLEREIRNEQGEVVCEMRMVSGEGKEAKDVRAEDVAIVFEGEVEVFPCDGEGGMTGKVQRVRTCLVEVRYDLTMTFTLQTPTSSTYSAPEPVTHSLTATDVYFYLPASLASPAYDPSASSTTLGSSAPSFAVEVDREEYPALAALYGGTSSQGGEAAHVVEARQRPDDLPAYHAGGSIPPAVDTKSSEGLREVSLPPPRSAPPVYAEPSLLAGPSFSAPSCPSASFPDTVPELEQELPPTWEDAVRDDMVDDWVAANAVYGEEERGR